MGSIELAVIILALVIMRVGWLLERLERRVERLEKSGQDKA